MKTALLSAILSTVVLCGALSAAATETQVVLTPNVFTAQFTPGTAQVQPVVYDGWRYRYYNNRWWYWGPNNSWSYWYGNAWVPYGGYGGGVWVYVNPYPYRYYTGYRGPYYQPYGYRYYGPRYGYYYGRRGRWW